MLVLSVKEQEQVILVGNFPTPIRVQLLDIKSGRIKLGFVAPPEISIRREAVLKRQTRLDGVTAEQTDDSLA